MKNDTVPILKVEGVTKTFTTPQGPLTILREVSFSVLQGEKVAIVGPSGSGKSTLLALIGLLDTPAEGKVMVKGTDIGTLSEPEQARFRNMHIGFVFQSFELIEPFTVTENIEAPLDIRGDDVDHARVRELIDHVDLHERAHTLPYTLSGGEKQRVAIARALVHAPTLILADEPTGSLDRITGKKVLDLLLTQVEKTHGTLVVITHDEAVAERMDRIFELRDRTLYERPHTHL